MVLRLGSSLVLTRLLNPAAYGIFGTAMAVLTVLDWFSDLGVQPALVRHPEGGRREFLNTGWWMNLGRGLVLMTATAVLAYPLALAYRRPELFGVLATLALWPAIMALRSPGLPTLRRAMRYRALCVAEVVQTTAQVAAGVALALILHSVWAIALAMLVGATTAVAVSYVLCPVRPGRGWDPAALREIAHLSRQIFVNTLVMALWLNLDRLLGLKFVGQSDMGRYFVALNLVASLEAFLGRGCDVYFSMLSRCAELDRRQSWHRKAGRLLSTWAMPALAAGVVLAPPFFGILYDARYAAAKVLVGILMARFMLRCLAQVQYQYLASLAEVRLNTRAYYVALVAQLVLFLPLTKTWGVAGMAAAGLASEAIMVGAQSLILRLRRQGSLLPYLLTLAWAATGLAVMATLWRAGVLG
jgi:O-antigen/teichoic acid export membrane protein